MNFWQSFNPFNTPPWIDLKDPTLMYRERILQGIFLGMGVFGTISLVIGISIDIQRRVWGTLAFDIFMLVTLLVLTFWRRLKFGIRAACLVALIYAISLGSLATDGLSGEGRMILVTVPIVGTMLLGLWGGVVSVLVGLITHFVVGYLMTNHLIPQPALAVMVNSGSAPAWYSSLVFYGSVVIVSASALYFLLNGLKDSVTRQRLLSREIEAERDSLDKRVNLRTQELERRLVQIRTAAEISRSIGSILDQQKLLQFVVDLIQESMQLYYVGAFLMDDTGQFAVLRAGTGEPGRKMIASGHHLQVGETSMIGWCIANRKARIALDVGLEAVRFNNPALPRTRSEIALPLATSSRVLGALSIQSAEANAFDDEDILIFQGIADSLSVALENASLFQQTQQNLEEIQSLNRHYLSEAWSQALDTYGQMEYTYENPDPTHANETKSVTVPITLRDQIIGQITLDMEDPSLSPEDSNMVESIATQTALTLESARLLAETQRKASQEEKINQLGAIFARAVSIDDILKSAVQELAQLPSVAEVTVHLKPSEKVVSDHQEFSIDGDY